MSIYDISARLVDYSSDEEQSEEYDTKIKDNKISLDYSSKIKSEETNIFHSECNLLPLPSEIKYMFTGEIEDTRNDDPEKHGGKIRSFPHERGVWATYIYIQYDADVEFLKMVENLINISEKHGILLKLVDDFHVSLSRTVKLRHHWIQSFTDDLRAHLKHFIKFKIMFQSLEVYENEEKTRTFIGLKIHFGYEYLCKIIENVDACLAAFKLPVFYMNPSFHLSCAACVGSKAKQIDSFMPDLNAVFQSFAETHPACRTLWVTNIWCKSGNKFFSIPLKS